MQERIDAFMAQVAKSNANEPEFLQAVQEVAETVIPFIAKNPKYSDAKVLERMIEPERTIMFRVAWTDDNGDVQINRGYRVEFNSAIGPYKGGLRFHPSVNLSILKFLGFEHPEGESCPNRFRFASKATACGLPSTMVTFSPLHLLTTALISKWDWWS